MTPTGLLYWVGGPVACCVVWRHMGCDVVSLLCVWWVVAVGGVGFLVLGLVLVLVSVSESSTSTVDSKAVSGVVSGRVAARVLRDRLGDILSPVGEAPGVRGCGDSVGGHARVVRGGVVVEGQKSCSSAFVCPVHSPARLQGRLGVFEGAAREVVRRGGGVVGFPVFVPHRWDPVGVLADVVSSAVWGVIRSRKSKAGPARWSRMFRELGVAGFVVVVEPVFSPLWGWNVHAHGHALVRDAGRVEAVASLVEESVSAEVGRASGERLTDGFYRGEPDRFGRRAVVVQSAGWDGRLRWGYYAVGSPEHPEDPRSRFFEGWRGLQLDRPPGHFEVGPGGRPGLGSGGLGVPLWLGDPVPVGTDPGSWDPSDEVWARAVELWEREGLSGGPVKGFELVRDVGGLVLAGSVTAGRLYREAVLGLSGRSKVIGSRGLVREFVPGGGGGWSVPESGGFPDVFVDRQVVDGLRDVGRGCGVDYWGEVCSLLGDGDVRGALNFSDSVLGRGVELTRVGDDFRVSFS